MSDFKELITIVLRLLHDRGDQVVLLGDLCGFHDLDSGPLRSAPVVGEVEFTNALSECFHDFFHGCADIGTVSKDDVDVWCL